MKNKITLLLMPLAAALSLAVYKFLPDSKTALQILVILVVIMLIVLRYTNINSYVKYKLFQNLLYPSLTFFVILLVTSTGGFLSPFFILIHLTTLAFAFMFSLSGAIIFLSSAIITSSTHLYFFFPIDYETVDNVLLVVYLLSLVTIVPISFYIARKYDVSTKLSNYLGRELLISQKEKTLILGNIQEGVITTDADLKILDINGMAEKLIKLDINATKDKQFFEIFSFQNKYGAQIKKQDFQPENLLKTQTSFKKENLIMNVSNGITLKSINVTFSSSVDDEGKVTGIIFLFNDLTKEALLEEVQNIIEISFKKFESLPDIELKKSLKYIHLLYQFQNAKFNESSRLTDISEIIKKISQNYKNRISLLLDQKIQRQEAIGNEKIIPTNANIRPLSIVTNQTILEKALFCLINLAMELNPNANKPITIDSKLQEEIQVIINTNHEPTANMQAEQILRPFFGQLENNPTLKNSVGLEGYIAKILLEEIGASVSITSDPTITFTIKLPYLKKVA